jgi:hypothetical protein
MTEIEAMSKLLGAHPKWGKTPVSIRMALRCLAVPRTIKLRYLEAVTEPRYRDDRAKLLDAASRREWQIMQPVDSSLEGLEFAGGVVLAE